MFGTDSVLNIKSKLSNNRTIVEDSFFTAPFKIVKPFYNNESNVAEVMVMSASAGVMEGDCYQINIEAGKASALSLQGQSYTKIHKMHKGYAKQLNVFKVQKDAFFDYDPKPTIPFAHSDYISETSCYLEQGSRYVYSEILACGREKSGELFRFRRYKNCNRVFYCGKLIFLDNQVLQPEIQNLSSVGFFEGYTHQATIAYFLDEMDRAPVVEKLYEILQSFNNVEAGITTTYKYGIVIRLLSNGSDYLEGIVKKLRKEIYNCSFGV
jgi:urease accessory protein